MEVGPEELARFFEIVRPHLNERQRRVVAGACSQMLGHGGKSTAAQASGMSRSTVGQGCTFGDVVDPDTGEITTLRSLP